ncbi:MAG TPA: flagellar hook capping FlgD N-terminal domain-containing protein [Sphingomonas sp.]|jgi:flagellar basal-body rod modification protein FlgD|uniref:flagellar hook assembly protein FlgD n=1 Tax=Sphingomonas sp. TaxID=28214 RepID=UPI002ED8F064
MATSFDATVRNLGIGTPTTGPVVKAAGSQSLGQNDFLKLLTAQLKNQDPFEPVDNTQMVAQMAQFSSLAGISEMGTTLKSIADRLGGTTSAEALGYVGRTVLTEGATAYGRSTGGIEGAVELDGAATDVTVTLSSVDGQVLKTLRLGKQPAGTASFDWDGRTDAGGDAGAGPFTVTAQASGAKGEVTARTLVWAPVQTVSMNAGSPVLDVAGLGPIPVTAVRKVG